MSTHNNLYTPMTLQDSVIRSSIQGRGSPVWERGGGVFVRGGWWYPIVKGVLSMGRMDNGVMW